MITTAAVPSTAVAVTLVTSAATGAEHVLRLVANISAYEHSVLVISAVVSLFVSYFATSVPLLWRFALWPINFLVLVYLVFASTTLNTAVRNTPSDPPVGTSHVLNQTIIPGGGQ